MSEPAGERFAEPWQAEVFALTVALNEAGLLDWQEWAAYLSAAIDELADPAAKDGPITDADEGRGQADYYRAWTRALEALVHARGWAQPLQLLARRESLRAYNRVVANPASFGDGRQSRAL